MPPQQTPNQEVFAQAVKQYQSAQRITDDGILGPTTWKHIRAELPAARNNPNSSKGGAAPWIVVARGELGTKEFAGDKHNPRVIEYLKTTGSWWSTDETPWCSGFVNWVMQQAGYTGTNSAKAISWLTWGKKVSEPVLGAIGVISYGGGKGHVGFVVGTQGKNVLLLGGNQSNQVSINRTPVSKFSAFVVPQDYEAQSAAPTVEGSEKGVHQDLSYESTR
ncbi:TIGR02594 family protein [bacterium]|nr:TIGR02594 family protein [bacterium]